MTLSKHPYPKNISNCYAFRLRRTDQSQCHHIFEVIWNIHRLDLLKTKNNEYNYDIKSSMFVHFFIHIYQRQYICFICLFTQVRSVLPALENNELIHRVPSMNLSMSRTTYIDQNQKLISFKSSVNKQIAAVIDGDNQGSARSVTMCAI